MGIVTPGWERDRREYLYLLNWFDRFMSDFCDATEEYEEEDIEGIIKMLDEGYRHEDVAYEFGVPYSAVTLIDRADKVKRQNVREWGPQSAAFYRRTGYRVPGSNRQFQVEPDDCPRRWVLSIDRW